jgi:hypothetical protein
MTAAVQSAQGLQASQTGVANDNTFFIDISDNNLWVCTHEEPHHGPEHETVTLVEHRWEYTQLDLPQSTSRNTLTFDVKSGAREFYIATIPNGAFTNTQFAGTVFSATTPPYTGIAYEKYLQQVSIDFDGQKSDPYLYPTDFLTGGSNNAVTDYRHKMWLQMQQETGLYYYHTGCESFNTFGGPNLTTPGYGEVYMNHFEIPPGNKATRAQVTYLYSVAPVNCRMGLFTLIPVITTLKLVNGECKFAETADC